MNVFEILLALGKFVFIFGILYVAYMIAIGTVKTEDESPRWEDIRDDVLKSEPKYKFDIFKSKKR